MCNYNSCLKLAHIVGDPKDVLCAFGESSRISPNCRNVHQSGWSHRGGCSRHVPHDGFSLKVLPQPTVLHLTTFLKVDLENIYLICFNFHIAVAQG